MNKRGLTTIFVILGLILIIIIFLVFFQPSSLSNAFAKESIQSWETFEDVQKFEEALDDCTEEQTIKALKLLGSQSGYLYPKDYTKLSTLIISEPNTIEQTTEELELYLKNNLERNCFYGQEQNLNEVTVTINQNIEVETDWDLKINEQIAKAPKIKFQHPLYDIFQIVEEINTQENITPKEYSNTTIEVTTLDYNSYIYTITQDDYIFLLIKP